MHELWDPRSGNALGEFESLAAALEAMRETLDLWHVAAPPDFELIFDDGSEDSKSIASGAALIALARQSAAA